MCAALADWLTLDGKSAGFASLCQSTRREKNQPPTAEMGPPEALPEDPDEDTA